MNKGPKTFPLVETLGTGEFIPVKEAERRPRHHYRWANPEVRGMAILAEVTKNRVIPSLSKDYATAWQKVPGWCMGDAFNDCWLGTRSLQQHGRRLHHLQAAVQWSRLDKELFEIASAAHRRDTAHSLSKPIRNLGTSFYCYRNGVERQLATVLKLKFGDAFPDVSPIQVFLPWPWQM